MRCELLAWRFLVPVNRGSGTGGGFICAACTLVKFHERSTVIRKQSSWIQLNYSTLQPTFTSIWVKSAMLKEMSSPVEENECTRLGGSDFPAPFPKLLYYIPDTIGTAAQNRTSVSAALQRRDSIVQSLQRWKWCTCQGKLLNSFSSGTFNANVSLRHSELLQNSEQIIKNDIPRDK